MNNVVQRETGEMVPLAGVGGQHNCVEERADTSKEERHLDIKKATSDVDDNHTHIYLLICSII